MRRGWRVGKDNIQLRDYVFTDMGGDHLGITSQDVDRRRCGCNLKEHLTIQTRGTWSPNNAEELDELIRVLSAIRDGVRP